MSKRPTNESYMPDEESNLESLKSPTPKIARTNVFPICSLSSDSDDTCSSSRSHALLDDEEVANIEEDLNYEFQVNEPSSSSNGTIVKKSGIDITDDAASANMAPDYFQQLEQNGKPDEEEGSDEQGVDGESGSVASGSSSLPSPTLSLPYEDIFGIATDTCNLREAVHNLSMVLPENYQERLQQIVKEPSFPKLFKRFMLHHSNTYLCTIGRDAAVCEDSKEFIDRLNSLDDNIFCSHVGAALVKDYMESRINNDEKDHEAGIQDEPEASTSGCTRKEFCAMDGIIVPWQGSAQSKCSSFPKILEGHSSSTLPPVPSFDTDNGAIQNDPQKVAVSSHIWEQASDFPSTADSNEKIRKIGQVLFVAIFTPTEILECTVKGKNNTKIFDAPKIRFLKRAIAWILTGPKSRTQEDFEIYVKDKDPRLSKSEEDFFTTKVLSEFAYSQRKKLKNVASKNN